MTTTDAGGWVSVLYPSHFQQACAYTDRAEFSCHFATVARSPLATDVINCHTLTVCADGTLDARSLFLRCCRLLLDIAAAFTIINYVTHSIDIYSEMIFDTLRTILCRYVFSYIHAYHVHKLFNVMVCTFVEMRG